MQSLGSLACTDHSYHHCIHSHNCHSRSCRRRRSNCSCSCLGSWSHPSRSCHNHRSRPSCNYHRNSRHHHMSHCEHSATCNCYPSMDCSQQRYCGTKLQWRSCHIRTCCLDALLIRSCSCNPSNNCGKDQRKCRSLLQQSASSHAHCKCTKSRPSDHRSTFLNPRYQMSCNLPGQVSKYLWKACHNLAVARYSWRRSCLRSSFV